ncbi:hypothetical protein SHO565_53480 [Streptomyces sp. HO565]
MARASSRVRHARQPQSEDHAGQDLDVEDAESVADEDQGGVPVKEGRRDGVGGGFEVCDCRVRGGPQGSGLAVRPGARPGYGVEGARRKVRGQARGALGAGRWRGARRGPFGAEGRRGRPGRGPWAVLLLSRSVRGARMRLW